jgi:hypothetical protein
MNLCGVLAFADSSSRNQGGYGQGGQSELSSCSCRGPVVHVDMGDIADNSGGGGQGGGDEGNNCESLLLWWSWSCLSTCVM